MIRQIYDPDSKRKIARKVLEALHDWFEADESREKGLSLRVQNRYFLLQKQTVTMLVFSALKRPVKKELSLL